MLFRIFPDEVALALQFRLEVLEPADIEHQAAILRHPALIVLHRESVDENINHRSVATAERLLMISDHPVFLHLAGKFLVSFLREINLGANIRLQQFLPAGGSRACGPARHLPR